MSIRYVTGDATSPVGPPGPKVLVHCCNDIGAWGAGFVLAISQRWPEPEAEYRNAFRRVDPPLLGDVQFVRVEPDLVVANLIGQRGIRRGRGRNGPPPVRYEALREGLRRVAEYAAEHGATVHMPRIGAGLAGGRWEEIEPILEETLVAAEIPVTVYDYSRSAVAAH